MVFLKLRRLLLLTASIITLNSIALGMLPGDPYADMVVKKHEAAAEADDICPVCLNNLADNPQVAFWLDALQAPDKDIEAIGPGIYLYKAEENPYSLSAYLPDYELDSTAPKTTKTPCNHTFHTCCLVKNCLHQIKEGLPISCPMCRQEDGMTNLWEKSLQPHIKKNMLAMYQEFVGHTGIDAVDRHGNTKLMQAIERYARIDEITNILQDARRTFNDEEFAAFVNHQNKRGDTALHMALCTYSPLFEAETVEGVITLLQENGANPDLRNKQGRSAMDIYNFLHPAMCVIQ